MHYNRLREFRVFGMRRFGNHAIIEWLASHFSHTFHFNECLGWPIPYHFWTARQYGDYSKVYIDSIIWSFEDFEPSELEMMDDSTVVILRDWYNTASSLFVSGRGLGNIGRCRHQGERKRSLEEIWIKYAELYTRYPDRFILFNEWVSNGLYRLDCHRRFSLPGEHPAPYTASMPKSLLGNGSSFGDIEIDPNTINRRYEILKEKYPEIYTYVVSNSRINELSKCIFKIEI